MMTMGRFRRTTLFSLLFFVLIALRFQPAALDEGGQNVDQNNYPEQPLFSKILTDTISLLRKSHKSSWEKIKTVIHDMQMQFSPPNLDFRGGGEGGPDGAKGTVKDAVGKSFDRSKDAVEESAKSAAKVVGEAIHKTSEKVKEKSTHSHSDSDQDSEAEL